MLTGVDRINNYTVSVVRTTHSSSCATHGTMHVTRDPFLLGKGVIGCPDRAIQRPIPFINLGGPLVPEGQHRLGNRGNRPFPTGANARSCSSEGPSRTRFGAVDSCLVSCWYPFRVWLRSSLPLHPVRLRLLDSSFPLQLGRCGAAMVQRPMCHTLKTLIHACNQTRSYLVLNQQQKQPNTIRCIVSACISPSWTGSPSRLPVTKATNHPLRYLSAPGPI